MEWVPTMIIKHYRPNVAALVKCGNLFVGCMRSHHPGWQSVQGGIDPTDESPEHAIFREMEEELGVEKNNIKITYRSHYWRRYEFVSGNQRKGENYCGQEQLWFVIEIPSADAIQLAKASSDEFTEVKLMPITELVQKYVTWKNLPFLDFCRELQLI